MTQDDDEFDPVLDVYGETLTYDRHEALAQIAADYNLAAVEKNAESHRNDVIDVRMTWGQLFALINNLPEFRSRG